MAERTVTVLVVDDEPAIRRSMEVTLSGQGYRVQCAADGEEALGVIAAQGLDLIVLDLGLPDMSGHDVIAAVRTRDATPIVVLSARDSDVDKVAALDAGADDYVTKPFSMDELLARVRSAVRRSRHSSGEADASDTIVTEHFTVDLGRTLVLAPDGSEIRLTPTEWHLVEVLARNAGKLVAQKQLLQEVWGPQYGKESNYLRVFMAQIRSKLEPDPRHPRYFHTDPGMGYRFEDRGQS